MSMAMNEDDVIGPAEPRQSSWRFWPEEYEEGLEFRKLMEADPSECPKLARDLLPRPASHRKFLHALTYTDTAGLDMGPRLEFWGSALRFCESALSPAPEAYPADKVLEQCGDLFRCKLDSNELPSGLHETVWRVIKKATKLAMSRAEQLVNPTEMWDAHTVSINSVAGSLTHAVLHYEMWRYRGLRSSGRLSSGLSPEVRSVLESALSRDDTHSIPVHAALGYNFIGLVAMDGRWSKEHLPRIFSHGCPDTSAGDAAWSAYARRRISRDAFQMMPDEYAYRIRECSRKWSGTARRHLAAHLKTAYLGNFDGVDGVLGAMVRADDSLLVPDFLKEVGAELQFRGDRAPPAPDVRNLLEYAKVVSNPDAGWLFLYKRMDGGARLAMLERILVETRGRISPMRLILDEMKPLVAEHPLKTAECIRWMCCGCANSAEMRSLVSYYEEISPLVAKTGDKAAIAVMRKLPSMFDPGVSGI